MVLTPRHSNLGDHAIAYAETMFLKELGISYIEITSGELNKLQKYKLLNVMNKYPILINGGGNMGTLWFGVEQLMRDIVIFNPKSKIAIMPNTIHYDNSDWGQMELQNSVKIYNKHHKLYMYSREKISYEVMHNIYKNVKLVPDVVLSLNETKNDFKRKGCLVCLRNDCEKILTTDEESVLESQLVSMFGDDFKYTDTHAQGLVPIENRCTELNNKLNEFKASELVITDRLHGMVFAAITATPCIVINSKSPKIKGCYEWVRNLDYIRFADAISQIKNIYEELSDREYQYDNTHLKPYFEELKQDILRIVGR